MSITIRSRKAKGHRVEDLICQRIIEAFSLSKEDVRRPIGSENGADIKMSNKARAKFPYSVEIKARKSFDTLYNFLNQAARHDPKLIPLVILKGDYKEPMAVINFDYFLSLVSK